MTASHHKLSSSLTEKASVLTLLLMVAGILFAAPSAMAQQIPLTSQELEQQNRLQNVIAATTRNLEQGEKEVNGVVFTPRWSNPVWVEADSLSILFAYCLPGEFADSGQEILGGFELEVLESYEIALPQNFMAWMMVIGNEDRQDRLPAAVGVVCASDTNDVQTRVLSPQEQQQINNVVQQFTNIQNTQVTNIEQVVNIINNVTSTTPQNGNTTTTPTTPDNTPPVFSNPIFSGAINTSRPEGYPMRYPAEVEDNVDGYAMLYGNRLTQDNVGGNITISCNPPSPFTFPVGNTTIQCTATDASGNTATHSSTVTIKLGGGGQPFRPIVPDVQHNITAGVDTTPPIVQGPN